MKKKRRKQKKQKKQKKQNKPQKKQRKQQRRHLKKQRKHNSPKKALRQGSKEVKRILLSINPCCDICGYKGELQLHHVYLIRHGFKTELEHCVLLCDKCHKKFHKKYDNYLDKLFIEASNIDFMAVYQKLRLSL